MRAYSNIYTLAALLHDILNKHKTTFDKLPNNKSSTINKICKFIYKNRELKGYGDILDQRILKFINGDDPDSDLKKNRVCLLV